MRYLKYLALLAVVIVLPAVPSHAQVSFGVQVGPAYGYYNAPPVCEYGYYPYSPYACAPYGYWGPDWFVNGVFVGAGPWYHFYYVHPEFWRGYYGRFYGRAWSGFRGDDHRFFHDDRGFRGREGFRNDDRGFRGREGFRGGDRDFRGGDRGFRGENRNFHSGENFRGGGRGEFHDGGHGESHGDHGGRR